MPSLLHTIIVLLTSCSWGQHGTLQHNSAGCSSKLHLIADAAPMPGRFLRREPCQQGFKDLITGAVDDRRETVSFQKRNPDSTVQQQHVRVAGHCGPFWTLHNCNLNEFEGTASTRKKSSCPINTTAQALLALLAASASQLLSKDRPATLILQRAEDKDNGW